MKRWARRNLPTVIFIVSVLLLIAVTAIICTPEPARMASTASKTPAFDSAAYEFHLMTEASVEPSCDAESISIEQEATAENVAAEPTQEADSEPCGKGGFECQDREDIERLATVIYQEAGGDACCDTCRYRVADIVLNRVADPRFPDNIEDVLTAPRQYGTFSVTGVVWPERAALPGEAHAVDRAWEVAENVLTGTHSDVYGEGYIFQAEFPQGEDTASMIYCEQCNMWYCKG